MKNIKTKILVWIAITFAFVWITNAETIYFSDNKNIYKKDTVSLEQTTIRTNIYWYVNMWNVSKDWSTLYFCSSDSNWLNRWLRTLNLSTSVETLLVNIECNGAVISPDWNKLVYVDTATKSLYLKNAPFDSWTWTKITSSNQVDCQTNTGECGLTFTSDSNYIIYTKFWSPWDCWKKNLTVSDWSALNTWWCINPIITKDNTTLYFLNQFGDKKIYKKDIVNNTANVKVSDFVLKSWTQILFNKNQDKIYYVEDSTSRIKYFDLSDPTVSTYFTTNTWNFRLSLDTLNTSPNCFDWIQNQDEIAIDYWWVCTTPSEYRFDWCTQRTIKYYWTGATTVYNMWGLSNYGLFVADVSNESEWLKVFWLWQSKIEQYTFDDW